MGILTIKLRGQYMGSVFLSHKYFAMAIFLISFGACAENGTAWDLDNLQKQRVLYEAKAAVNKAKAEADSHELGSVSTNIQPSNGNSTLMAAPVGEQLPQLIKINGRNAVISTADGNTATVAVGQMLPGGRWQVLSVGLGGVKVKNVSTQKTQVIN